MTNSWHYLAADYYAALEAVTAGVTVLIIISAIDDLVMDTSYWAIRIGRYFSNKVNPYRPLTLEQLTQRTICQYSRYIKTNIRKLGTRNKTTK